MTESNRPWLMNYGSLHRFELMVRPDGRLVANPQFGSGRPVAVISIPKAGTYLAARFLQQLGLVDSELHVSDGYLTDYRGLTRDEKRSRYGAGRTVYLPLTVTAHLLGPGQFLVGHIPCTDSTVGALNEYSKIFLVRDLVAATISHCRFMVSAGRGAPDASWMVASSPEEQLVSFLEEMGEALIEGSYRPLFGWMDQPDVCVLRFEALTGTLGAELQRKAVERLVVATGRPLDGSRESLLQSVLGQPTPTLSDTPTVPDLYWSSSAEMTCRRIGLLALRDELEKLVTDNERRSGS